MKKGVGSGSISHRYGSGDPDPQQNAKDLQHCLRVQQTQTQKLLPSSWKYDPGCLFRIPGPGSGFFFLPHPGPRFKE
jgi:hypothetical protein